MGPGVTVTDAAVTGTAGSENAGWITFDPALGRVVNDGNGNLSGYAWGENIGWVSFSSSGAAPFQIVTAWRRDSDDVGTPDCSDNCPSDPAKTEPGACGCGVADTDSDDGMPGCTENVNSAGGGSGGSGCFINSVVQRR